MTDAKKDAAPGQEAAKGNAVSVNGKSDNSTGVDRLTVLETAGKPPNRLVFAKTHKVDGTTKPYDHPKSVKFKVREVSDLLSLAKLLKELRGNPYACLIGGAPLEDRDAMEAAPVGKPFVLRCKKNFVDQPLHTLMLDIDDYQPENYDPQTHPVLCIVEFIEKHLPEAFHKASFIWHLSNSAGLPGKEHVLKAHVWFWSRTPYSCSQYDAWALVAVNGCRRQKPLVVDTSIYSQEHVRYTADPVFEEGRPDPIDPKLRFGLYRHEDGTDVVDLVIGDDVLAAAQEIKNPFGRPGGSDVKLTDPSEKEGLIGAFHRAFDAERVLLDFLEGEFEQATERRYTWLNSDSGAPEGVWVTDDSMHVGASHNSWPFGPDRVVNLWDLVRVLKFGHLDIAGEDADDFDRLNIEQMPVGRRPSDAAMRRWAEGLPELQAAVREEQAAEEDERALARQAAIDEWRQKIRGAADEFSLREKVCPAIAGDDRIDANVRELLAGEVKNAFRTLGVTLGLPAAKKLLAPPAAHPATDQTGSDSLPWLQNWCYVGELDVFYRHTTQERLSHKGFSAKYTRLVPKNPETGSAPKAADFVLDNGLVAFKQKAIYWPSAAEYFTYGGVTAVNLYSAKTVPEAAEKLTKAGKAAIECVEAHIRHICGEREAVAAALLDWLAFCVQNPGAKIRYAVLIQGIEGDGKTTIGDLLGHVMGQPNIAKISNNSIKSDFSGWAMGACVGVIEELRMQGHNRFDVMNAVKELVTNDVIPVIKKGLDQINVPNTMNYFATTNHPDALPLSSNDRRWMVIFTPWRDLAQFETTIGQDAQAYFSQLHAAIQQHAPALRRWLLDRDLSTFNPNARALLTDEKATMINLGEPDDVVLAKEVIEAQALGVYPNIVSSGHLTNEMSSIPGMSPPRGRRVNTLMHALGFQQFPSVVKWRGMACRVWLRTVTAAVPSDVVSLLDAAEKARAEEEDRIAAEAIEHEFSD